MKLLFNLLAFTALIFTTAANADISENSLAPQKEANFAQNYLDRFMQRDFDYVMSLIDTEVAGTISPEKLEEMHGYLPSGKLLSTELIGSQVKVINDNWEGSFTFEYHFEDGWALASAYMIRTEGKISIAGFSVYNTPDSQKELNRFSLSNKPLGHYLVLTMAIIFPVFILVTLVTCIRTPVQKRKWLWILFILFSVGAIKLNWTTGAYHIKLFSFQLFGGGAVSASEHAPLILTAGFPLGAIIFWFKRRSLIGQKKKTQKSQTELKESDNSV
ncbi:hypothetical protein ACJJIR_02995 [Microbulbifer sp. SSSA008]|uniref:hypothetical protein n=1 Tax=Microbulbifer sp. SSSA008 TaxID=3243380 RepID=UPI00403A3633